MAGMKTIRPLNVGVIGTGMISGIYLENMINRFDILNVTSIAARNYENTVKVADKYGIKACTVDELVADPAIDIVVNLTPAETRDEIINKILDAGKHAYTEKVFAPDTGIASRLCDKANAKANVAWAITEGRDMRASKERAYHVLDVQDSIFRSSEAGGAFVEIESTCERSLPLKESTGDEELSLRTVI